MCLITFCDFHYNIDLLLLHFSDLGHANIKNDCSGSKDNYEITMCYFI